MNNQYFAYIRVSTVKQGEGVSLEAQREAIERYANQHGLIISRFFEEKETAAKQGRPVFTEMIKALKAREAKGVVMHKIDRSARNLRDWATVGELSDAGLDVHFAAESVDFTSRGGRLTADIQAVIAADYIRNLKDEVKKGQLGLLKQGLYPFYAPFGYLNMGSRSPKAIDPKNGPFVREMFELYATGEYSLSSLELEMYRRGMRSISGRKVYRSKIDNMLKNPFYMGIIRLKTFPMPFNGIHDPLVSSDLFARVQDARKNRTRKKKTKHEFLYRGVFSCRDCKRQYSPEKQRGHVYYRCHTKGCAGGCVREDRLEHGLAETLSTLEIDPRLSPQIFKALDASMQLVSTEKNAQVEALHAAQLDAELGRLTKGYIKGLIAEEEFKKQKANYEFRKLELSKSHKDQRNIHEKAAQACRFFEHLQNLCQTYISANHSEKRQILRLAFSNISIQDKKPYAEPKNWLTANRKGGFVRLCGANGDEIRRLPKLGKQDIEDIVDDLNCKDAIELTTILGDIKARNGMLD